LGGSENANIGDKTIIKKCIAANWMLKSNEASQVYPASISSLPISKSSLPKYPTWSQQK
jgi:hypothetical protein